MRKRMAHLKDLLNKSKEQLFRAETRVAMIHSKISFLEKEIQCENAECPAALLSEPSETAPAVQTPKTPTTPTI